MSDLLIYFQNASHAARIEQFAGAKGLDVKSTADLNTAREWLRIREFKLAFLEATSTLEAQQSIGTALWQKRPDSRLVLFDLDGTSRLNRLNAMILGAEVARGEKALEFMQMLMVKASATREINRGEFKVLVAEDLDSPREIILTFLDALGYKSALGVRSGAKALEHLRSDPGEFSCVLTDFRMPEMTGRELIATIRSEKQLEHLPIVVITAHGTSDCLVDCLKAGASGFMVKPFKKADFTRELARAVRIFKSRENPRLVAVDEAEQVLDFLGRGL